MKHLKKSHYSDNLSKSTIVSLVKTIKSNTGAKNKCTANHLNSTNNAQQIKQLNSDIYTKYYTKRIQLHTKVIQSILHEILGQNKKMLVFGLGYDSELWYNANGQKNIYFIENNINWIKLNKSIPEKYIIYYEYKNISVKNSFNKTPKDITTYPIPTSILQNAPYDIILIDAPEGWNNDKPGRYIPITWSLEHLSNQYTSIYIDDINRPLENHILNSFYFPFISEYFHFRSGTVKLLKKNIIPSKIYKCINENKFVFYTALFTDNPKNFDIVNPFYKFPNCKYVLFTNLPRSKFNSNCQWQIITMNPPIKNNMVKSAKEIKWRSHKYLHEFDTAVWMDAYRSPDPKNIAELFDLITDIKKYSFVFVKHEKLNCIYDECDAVIKYKKDTVQNVNKNLSIFKKSGMPKKYGLYETGFFIRDNQSPETVKISEEVINMIIDNSHRDQLALTYILWKNKYNKFHVIDKPLSLNSGRPVNHKYT